MRRLLVAIAASALLVPGLALAGGPPSSPGKSQDQHGKGKAAPQVMYVLKGTLSGYKAASGSTDGSVTITVSRANRHGGAFVKAVNNATGTFLVSSSTKIVLHDGTTTISDGDKGIVKLRGPKSTADFIAALNAGSLKAFQVIDQGAPAAS